MIFLGYIINDAFDFESVWQGFLAVFVLLVHPGSRSPDFVAYRFFKKGAPPTPDLAIEEAKLTKAQFEHQGIERDQLGRSAGAYEQIEKGS